jgi:hypothetical protein
MQLHRARAHEGGYQHQEHQEHRRASHCPGQARGPETGRCNTCASQGHCPDPCRSSPGSDQGLSRPGQAPSQGSDQGPSRYCNRPNPGSSQGPGRRRTCSSSPATGRCSTWPGPSPFQGPVQGPSTGPSRCSTWPGPSPFQGPGQGPSTDPSRCRTRTIQVRFHNRLRFRLRQSNPGDILVLFFCDNIRPSVWQHLRPEAADPRDIGGLCTSHPRVRCVGPGSAIAATADATATADAAATADTQCLGDPGRPSYPIDTGTDSVQRGSTLPMQRATHQGELASAQPPPPIGPAIGRD